jgi:hypothetical protein
LPSTSLTDGADGRGLGLPDGIRDRSVKKIAAPDVPDEPADDLACIDHAGYPGRIIAEAMARVEETIEHQMKVAVGDWELYGATRANRTP